MPFFLFRFSLGHRTQCHLYILLFLKPWLFPELTTCPGSCSMGKILFVLAFYINIVSPDFKFNWPLYLVIRFHFRSWEAQRYWLPYVRSFESSTGVQVTWFSKLWVKHRCPGDAISTEASWLFLCSFLWPPISSSQMPSVPLAGQCSVCGPGRSPNTLGQTGLSCLNTQLHTVAAYTAPSQHICELTYLLFSLYVLAHWTFRLTDCVNIIMQWCNM